MLASKSLMLGSTLNFLSVCCKNWNLSGFWKFWRSSTLSLGFQKSASSRKRENFLTFPSLGFDEIRIAHHILGVLGRAGHIFWETSLRPYRTLLQILWSPYNDGNCGSMLLTLSTSIYLYYLLNIILVNGDEEFFYFWRNLWIQRLSHHDSVAFKPQGGASWVQGTLDKNSSNPVAPESWFQRRGHSVAPTLWFPMDSV